MFKWSMFPTPQFTQRLLSTEYELQVLAYTSAGDGPKSLVQVVKTKRSGKWWCLVQSMDDYVIYFGLS